MSLLTRRVLASRLVAIVRLSVPGDLLRVAEALIEGGITCLEFTITTPGALPAIDLARQRFGDAALIGAGTVITETQAEECIGFGAQFLVSPGFDHGVIAAAHAANIPAMPGALTPTEIIAAWRAGADIVKVFPARQFGPRYISDLLAPLPDILLMPTGGVDETNAGAYLRAGAAAVAVGGRLVAEADVHDRAWETITERARELVRVIAENSSDAAIES